MLHITQWLNKLSSISSSEGRDIEVYQFNHQQDPTILSAWAKHFREHYCPDNIIDDLISGTKLSRKDYFEQIVFPDKALAPGPSIRSGDFGELLVADYLQFSLNYWVPRIRMENKAVRNESIKGCDVIGFKIVHQGEISDDDELAIYECKASLSRVSGENRLQTAINDSAKDTLRKAEALNFLKRKLIEKSDQMWKNVERFQNPEDDSYKETNGAAAILSSNIFDHMHAKFISTEGNQHPNFLGLKLLIIHGDNLMQFVNALYERAANEA